MAENIPFLRFTNSQALEAFLRRKLDPVIVNKVEFCVLDKYKFNRLLFTAEHAVTKRIYLPHLSKKAYIGIGDKNTDILAKIGAVFMRSAYILPLFCRTEADASRNPEELGKGLRVYARIFYSKKQKFTFIPIHTDPSYYPFLKFYNSMIEELNPKVLISVHGINKARKFDILLGFGKNYMGIGGKKNAFRFKLEFINFLDKVFSKIGLKNNLEIAVSTWRFTGSTNFILSKHVIDYNKKIGKNIRMGFQVEFNYKGRASDNDKKLPSLQYQIAVQALGLFSVKWYKENY